MLNKLYNILMHSVSKKMRMDPESAAKLLQIDPALMKQFDKSYLSHYADIRTTEGDLFERSIKTVKETGSVSQSKDTACLEDRIVNELIGQMAPSDILTVRSGRVCQSVLPNVIDEQPVTKAEIAVYPDMLQPQLTGDMMQCDINDTTSAALLFYYDAYLHAGSNKKAHEMYVRFRNGLDTLDLDWLSYQMLSRNPNNISHWLPGITQAASTTLFFKIPDTTVIKVPLTLLQMTRLQYETLTRTTLNIADKFCTKVFELDDTKEYFVKTGTYSSKYNFRNCKIAGAKEVRELGEYLLFIQNQATLMGSLLNSPCLYGVSTTNEWAVREFIQDKEDNPTIYHGMPLHTEYRIFVDFDSQEILGMSPYWESNMLKKRFSQYKDSNNIHDFHDYEIILAYENVLNGRYEANKDRVREELEKIIPYTGLSGQWSVDVMQNGNDFYIIDMALAAQSALSECVPAGKLKQPTENWLPDPDKLNLLLQNNL